METTVIRELSPSEEGAAELLLDAALGGRRQARLGEVHDVLAVPGLGAFERDRLVGVATYATAGDRVELAALVVAPDRRVCGIAGALIERVVTAATAQGAREVWLVTTNDNLDALRLYQRHGFQLVELIRGAVDRAREQKPSIPVVGQHGIPLHDEMVLARVVSGLSQRPAARWSTGR